MKDVIPPRRNIDKPCHRKRLIRTERVIEKSPGAAPFKKRD